MFFFLACIATPAGGVSCTSPTVVQSAEVCKALEESYRGAAQVIYRTVQVSTRCTPVQQEKPVDGPLIPPLIKIP